MLRTHPLHEIRKFTMVTEFSQWLSAIETQDFTLINPMDEGMIEAAINVLQPKSSDLILQGKALKSSNTDLSISHFCRNLANLG